MFLKETRILLKCALAIAATAALALCVHPAYAEEDEDIEAYEIEEQIKEADEQFTEEFQTFLSVELPEALKRLEQYRRQAESPSAGPEQKTGLIEALMSLSDIVEELTETREYLPEAYERLKEVKRMEIQSEDLAELYRTSSDEKERKEIGNKITEILKQNFSLSQEIRRLEAAQIEKELNEINAVIKKREADRDIIIERRLHELLHGVDPLEW